MSKVQVGVRISLDVDKFLTQQVQLINEKNTRQITKSEYIRQVLVAHLDRVQSKKTLPPFELIQHSSIQQQCSSKNVTLFINVEHRCVFSFNKGVYKIFQTYDDSIWEIVDYSHQIGGYDVSIDMLNYLANSSNFAWDLTPNTEADIISWHYLYWSFELKQLLDKNSSNEFLQSKAVLMDAPISIKNTQKIKEVVLSTINN